MTDYYAKYMKYKIKYMELKNGSGIGNTIAKGIVAALMSQVHVLKSQVKNMKPEDVNKTIALIEGNLQKIPEEYRGDIVKVLNEVKKSSTTIKISPNIDPAITHPASV